MLVDLNHRSGFIYGRAADAPIPLGARINAIIDVALVAEREGQRPRDYLGASRIGEPCARRLVYEVTHTPPDPGKAKRTSQPAEPGDESSGNDWMAGLSNRLSAYSLADETAAHDAEPADAEPSDAEPADESPDETAED